jgi:sporulation protein YlmC with PRC-barrel domain
MGRKGTAKGADPMRNASLAAAATLLVSGTVAAQEELRRNQQAQELRADWIVGTTVTSPQGETIGTVDDLLLDQDEGSVSAAIVSVGGFLGFGAKQIAVNWDDLEQADDGSEIVLALTREQADKAPSFNFRDQELPTPAPATGDPGGMPAPAPAR